MRSLARKLAIDPMYDGRRLSRKTAAVGEQL
jgi:hypothetical protein